MSQKFRATVFRSASITAAVVAAIGFGAPAAEAALITNGFTFAVASGSSNQSTGTHYHSNTGGSFGNPAGKAEVGRYSSEEVRGLSEYDLTGQSVAASAFVTFNVYKQGGLFSGTNDTPFTGTITVEAYAGNNAEDISDYQAASLGTVGSFAVSAGGVNVGDVFSFDITSLFNTAIAAADTSFGIRLRADPLNPQSQAWTFDTFRLTTDNQCAGQSCNNNNVPEPATLALLGLGLVGLVGARRRKQ